MRKSDEPLGTLRPTIEALADEETAELIAEVRSEARAKVRAILVEAMTQALLDRSAAQLTHLLLATPQAEDPVETCGSTEEDAATVAPTSAASERLSTGASASEPAVVRVGDDELGWYVYGVLGDSGQKLPVSLTGITDQHDVGLVVEGDVAAVVSQVPLSAFGEQKLRESLNDADWLERTARAHERVLQEVRAHATVVPTRLCTIYRSERSLRQMLAHQRPALAEALQRLTGKTEWGLKVFVDPPVVERAAKDADAELARLDDELADASPGAAYIRRKQLERLLRDATHRLIDDCVDDTHARLSTLAVQARRNPPQHPDASGHSALMVLNGAYLVEDAATDDFHRCVATLATRYALHGCKLEATGPWAPYNFVDNSLEAA